MKTAAFIAAATLAFGALGCAAPAGAITWLAGGTTTCSGIACGQTGAASFSRQLTAEDFGGLTNISSFQLDRGLLAGREGAMFRLTFWTAQGEQVGDFGHFVIAGLAGDAVTLKGTGFDFDPAWGDLYVHLDLDLPKSGGGFGGFGGQSAPPEEGGLPTFGGADTDLIIPPPPPPGDDLPTNGVRSAAPEPASWALMITGFGAAGAFLRRKRKVVAAI